MQRILHPELLDQDSGSPQEVVSALRSLRWVNRFFGGNRMHVRLLTKVADRASKPNLHILEVACGHAVALQAAALKLQPTTPNLRMTLLDQSPLHFPTAALWDARLPQPSSIVGDALQVPLPDNSVDIVSCCLFLHHLKEAQAADYLRESLRLARAAVVLNDLERTPLHYALARAFSLIDPSRLSRHDGPVSVRQAYTRAELQALLQATGHRYEIQRGYLCRLGAIIWK